MEETAVNVTNLSVELHAARDAVFDYLSNIENLPEWATEFCRGLRRVDGHYKVRTSGGELFMHIEADRRTGVIDLYASPTLERMDREPLTTRVLAGGNGASIYVVSFVQPAELPDEAYGQQCAALKREMENIRRRFA